MRRLLIAVSILVVAPAAALAGNRVSGTFTGKSSQGKEESITIVRNRITHSTFRWRASCPLPFAHLTGVSVLSGRLRRHRYHVHDSYTAPVRGGGMSKHFVTAGFTVKGHVLRGRFRLVAAVYSSTGAKRVVCRTRTIRYTLES
jgi:hypothetical protein